MHLFRRKEKPMFHAHVSAFRTFVNRLRLPWNSYQQENLVRLGAAVIQRRSLPVRRLARTLAGPTKSHRAADKRLRRFLGNPALGPAALDAALAAHLSFLLARFGAVPFVLVMLDWTFLPGRAVLWAQIPYRGRSLPLFALVQHVPLTKDEEGRTAAEKQLLLRLQRCWPATAPSPVLLADRGFDKAPLLSWLIATGWQFIVRIKRGNHLVDAQGHLLNDAYDADGHLVQVGSLHPEPGKQLLFPQITYLQKERLPLHLAVSAIRDPKTLKVEEWRLVTNLPAEQLWRVPKLYAHRMPPEEVHRDSKRGFGVSGFGLSHLGRLRPDRLERLIFMFSLIYGYLVLVAETARESREWLCERHWGLSLAQYALDLLHAPDARPLQIAHQACASVRLEPLWPTGGDC
jgi:Transposase DDE domain